MRKYRAGDRVWHVEAVAWGTVIGPVEQPGWDDWYEVRRDDGVVRVWFAGALRAVSGA
jgi:hypothetical protein